MIPHGTIIVGGLAQRGYTPAMTSEHHRLRVLFLWTGNACRSQMAEGWARHLHPSAIEAHSAGTHLKGVDPLAIRAMSAAGIDLSTHRSKHLSELSTEAFDFVITLCDSAAEARSDVSRRSARPASRL